MSMRSYLRRISIPVLLLALLAGCQSDEAKLAEHMARGDAYVEEKKNAEAIIEYKSVIQIDPNHPRAHHELARALLRNRQFKDGYWEMSEAVRLDPANVDARIEFAQLAILGKDYDEALVQTEAAIEADPKKVVAYLMKGQALEALKRSDESLAAFEQGLAVAPEDPVALGALAAVYDSRGMVDKAEATYQKLIQIQPSANAHIAYGRFLARAYEDERDPEVESSFRQGIEVAKPEETADAYAALATYYYTRERFDDVVTLLQQGIEKQPDSVELIYLLARFYSTRGDEPKARELIEQATKAKPDDPKPFLILSAYRARQGDSAGALEAAKQALAVAPDDRTAQLRYSELLVEIGFKANDTAKVEEGRKVIDEILAEQPSHPGALFVQAKIEVASNQIDEAITSARAAINGRPNWAEAHFVLGAALAVKNDNPAARNELGRALEIDPNLHQAQQVLAKVHEALGEHEYAIENGRRFLQSQPDNLEMRLLVAQSLVRLGKLKDARAELEKIDESKRGAEGNYALARVYLGLGDNAQARKYLELADAAIPRNPDILSNLLTLDSRENRMAESTARINAAIEADPKNAKLQQLAGTLALMTGRTADAEALFKKAIELDPNDLSGYEQLARLYSGTGRLEETVKTYEQAIAVKPDQANLHHFLGVLYELGGRRELAVARYEDAIRLDPNLGEAKNNLAYLLAESGQNLDRALDLAQDAKSQLPENASVADTLGWVLYKRGMSSAAISYLKEAEAGTDPNDASIGIVRYHLALAYEANGDTAQAREALDRSLAGFDKQLAAARAKGANPAEPPWVKDVRAMLERLKAKV